MLRKLNPFAVVLAFCVAYLAVDYAVVHVVPSVVGIAPAPITVLVIEETGGRQNLTAGQRDVLLSTAPGSVREYLDKHCAKGVDGLPMRRYIDKDTKLDQEPVVFQEAFASGYPALPAIKVTNGVQGEAFTIVDREQALRILKKYGGP